MRSISRQPSERMRLPFAVKEWPPQSKVAVTASYTYGSADAHSSLQQTKKKQIALAQGQSLDIRFFNLHRGDNGVVIGYILVGDHGLHQREEVADPHQRAAPSPPDG